MKMIEECIKGKINKPLSDNEISKFLRQRRICGKKNNTNIERE